MILYYSIKMSSKKEKTTNIIEEFPVNKENTQIEKLADSLNKLNYAFLDELPF